MKYIKKQIYYHVQKNVIWNKGQTHEIGNIKNPWVGFLDTNVGSPFHHPITGESWCMLELARKMVNYIDTGKKDPNYSFYHYNPSFTTKELTKSLEHYLKVVRELLFEEERVKKFPDLPSRYTCLWVIPEEREAIKYWWELFNKSGTIFKLELSGKIHRASSEYVALKTDSLNYIRNQAFKYWSGVPGTRICTDECLFEGCAQVIDVLDPSTL